MGLASGVHHLAISTGDMKGQLEFFCDVLGAELKALYWMHGVENTFHGFVKLNDTSYVAFVQGPTTGEIAPVFGVSHAGSAANPSAPGTMQHVAFNVDSLDDLLALRDRIRDRGVNVFGPLDHGMCHSIYFAGPENLALEIATSAVPIDERAWIDPEVVGLARHRRRRARRHEGTRLLRVPGWSCAATPDRPQQAAPADGEPRGLQGHHDDGRRRRDGPVLPARPAGRLARLSAERRHRPQRGGQHLPVAAARIDLGHLPDQPLHLCQLQVEEHTFGV